MAVKMVRMRPGHFVVLWETPPVLDAAPEAGSSRGEQAVRPPRTGQENGEADGERRQAEPPSIRSTERRHWTADLLGPATAGLMLHGVGGIGKSALAAEIVARASRLQPERMTTVIAGEVTADGFLAGLASALRRHPMAERADLLGEQPAGATQVAHLARRKIREQVEDLAVRAGLVVFEAVFGLDRAVVTAGEAHLAEAVLDDVP